MVVRATTFKRWCLDFQEYPLIMLGFSCGNPSVNQQLVVWVIKMD